MYFAPEYVSKSMIHNSLNKMCLFSNKINHGTKYLRTVLFTHSPRRESIMIKNHYENSRRLLGTDENEKSQMRIPIKNRTVPDRIQGTEFVNEKLLNILWFERLPVGCYRIFWGTMNCTIVGFRNLFNGD